MTSAGRSSSTRRSRTRPSARSSSRTRARLALAKGRPDAAAEDRENYEQRLRLTWEHQDGYDPLLGEIEMARHAMLQAEARMRLLIAYGREFTRPRPYKLEALAGGAGA